MIPANEIHDETWQRAFAEIGRMVGGEVFRVERQPRWRPAWFTEVETDDGIVPVYFRGDRGIGQGTYDIRHEYEVLCVLENSGIPVPHIYGFCDDPRGIVMAKAPGCANLLNANDDKQREAVIDDYVQILAEMHAIDPAQFEAVGLTHPSGEQELGLDDLPVWEKGYRQTKSRPEPLIEFVLLWLKRNVPANRNRTTFVTGDAAQFLFQDDKVTAVLDFELAHLGDPLGDLAAFRGRNISEPLGDISRAYKRYAEISGEELDLDVINFHAARFALNTPLAVSQLCANPFPGMNLPQYLSWYLVYGRVAIEIIAEVEGIELPHPELPAPTQTRDHANFDLLQSALEEGEGYANETARRMAQYARQIDQHAAEVDRNDQEQVSKLIGKSVNGWQQADAALEELVLTDNRSKDEQLIRYLYERTYTQELLLRPAMRELPNLDLQPITL